ncbi:MAG TPA: class II aldolase/adducin family protein [Prolixibacteraceae bacterium]|nr:class II aldolase/adducin family protein [Prolixibacteraceae bacterium]
MTEGYIKFNCNWNQKEIPIPEQLFHTLEEERFLLYELGLIGAFPDGIGFGNISVRIAESQSFFITGSATGQFAKLNTSHYAVVDGYSFEKNSISCTGLTKASAESLSHAAIYKVLPEVGAVVHIHCLWLWEKLRNNYPTTSAEIEYGTPEMAHDIERLASEMGKNEEKIIVMGGHREGILAFGRNLNEAATQILHIYNRYK